MKRRFIIYAVTTVLCMCIALGLVVRHRYFRQGEAIEFADNLEEFKYGSIGAEVDGLPYAIWVALPRVCPDLLPGGYESLGFISEPAHKLPIGVSVRQFGVERIGFNCATCHTAKLNDHDQIMIGAPAERLDLEAYTNFIFKCGMRDDIPVGQVIQAAEDSGVKLDLLDKLFYRFVIIPRARRIFRERADTVAWMKSRPTFGPGRTDALNPWRQYFGLNPSADSAIATVDFPSIWDQSLRQSTWLHWDGNNDSLVERNLSAALAGGATENSVDLHSVQRIGNWLLTLKPPPYPERVDQQLARTGRRVYEREKCQTCHDLDGGHAGQVTDLGEIGTDPERVTTLTDSLLKCMPTIGGGRPWHFTHYRKTNGYANPLLDGIWARAPYLHNGSVPTLWDLLLPPDQRPKQFGRGCGTFDMTKVGYQCAGPFEFNTMLPGNRNGGHDFGTKINDAERTALIEYLKTL